MRVFVTGATGFVGSAVVRELLGAGHEVVGLVRSDERADALRSQGAEAMIGSLEDLESLRSGAAAADGVIHTAFIHDFSDYARAAATDKRAIETLGEGLAGSNRPLVVTSGIAGFEPGRLVTEEDEAWKNGQEVRRYSEVAAMALASQGVRAAVVRLAPSVHGQGDHGFVPTLINIAREKGVSGYVGEGANRWAAVHRLDAAHLFRLALENATAGARFHGVGDEGVATREIAEVIGRQLNVPVVSVPVEKVDEHFGWLGRFFSANMAASSALTQQRLGWQPVNLSLLEDLGGAYYYEGGR